MGCGAGAAFEPLPCSSHAAAFHWRPMISSDGNRSRNRTGSWFARAGVEVQFSKKLVFDFLHSAGGFGITEDSSHAL